MKGNVMSSGPIQLQLTDLQEVMTCRDVAAEVLESDAPGLLRLDHAARRFTDLDLLKPLVIDGDDAENLRHGLFERLKELSPTEQAHSPLRRALRTVVHLEPAA